MGLCLMALVASACGSEGRTLSEPNSVYPVPEVEVDAPTPETVTTAEAAEIFTFNSPGIAPGGEIPPAYLCSTATVAPPLDWQAVPANAAELAIIVWEQTATPTYYWVVSGIDPATTRIGSLELPEEARQAITGGGQPGWFGPCTMEGTVKEIRFSLHALNTPTELGDATPTQDAVAAILSRSIGEAAFTATVSG